MSNKKQKSLILSTLVLFFGIVVVGLYSFMPAEQQEVLESYKIKFDTDGGNSIAAIEIEEWDSTNLPEDPTREGYIFIGWMLGDELYDFSQGVSEDITLRAGWKKIEPDKVYYTVTFDTDGGTTYANQVVEEGNTATRPENYPIKDGYTFTGWQVNGEDYNFNNPVTSDLVIVAVWEQNQEEEPNTPPTEDPDKTYTVRFNAGGGQLGAGCGNQTVKSGTRANNSCQVTRSGYTFAGWSPSITRNITRDTEFVAQWSENPKPPVSVTFYGNGGTIGGSATLTKSVASGTTLSAAGVATPTRTYYTFAGWAATEYSSVLGNSTRIDSALNVFYAKWNPTTLRVSCSFSDANAQTCLASVAGIDPSNISSLVINYTIAGQQKSVDALTTKMNVSKVFWENANSFTIRLKSEGNTSFPGSK
ncbi:MAG: InlB B-repeat-containing protein [Bacilli bacterium]|nr:InlB B-repeat-containing protein [Bacilli bacterium]